MHRMPVSPSSAELRGGQLGSDGAGGSRAGVGRQLRREGPRAHAHSPPSPDTTCACSCGRTSSQAGFPAPSSRMPCWAPTPCRPSWATTTPRSMWATMSASSASPRTRPGSWRRGSWSCTRRTGERASLELSLSGPQRQCRWRQFEVPHLVLLLIRGAALRANHLIRWEQ